MIAKMVKVTILCIREHTEASLFALQQMGVLHVEHVQEPSGTLLEETRSYAADVRRACDTLDHYDQERRKSGAAVPATGKLMKPQAVVDEVWRLVNHRKDYEESLDYWQREVARVEPFGSFDPHLVRELEAKGLHVQLCKAGPQHALEMPEDDEVCVTIHQQDRNGTYMSVIGRQVLELPYETIKLPEASLANMRTKIAELRAALQHNSEEFLALTEYLSSVREILHQAEDKVHFLEARTGMGSAKPLTYLRGYCPQRDVERIRSASSKLGWGLLVEDVTASDKAPTKIENPKWVEPIRSVFSFIGVVPGYEEIDISAVFLLFFSLFFAMIVGDAGYGTLFLGLTCWAHRKFKAAPASVFHLLYITSIATIVWGVLTGNYLGISALPGFIEAVKFNWLTDTANVMLLCFVIGAVHLTIAHTWNVLRAGLSLQALAQVGWICVVWSMFFLARNLVLNQPFPSVMMPVFAVGVVLLVLFMTPVNRLKEEWFNHIMLPLNLVSNFVDVVSYVRLFAVGTATLAVAQAFNQMAMDIGAGGLVSQLVAALILLLGHTLNIILAAMGVLVHGIRLNTLEFAGHIGLQWTGIRFMPFIQKSKRGLILLDEKIESDTESVQ